MKIILTGSTGFLGSNFQKYCLSEGHSILPVGRIGSKEDSQIIDLEDPNFDQKINAFSPDLVVDLATHFDLSPLTTSNNLLDGSFSFHLKLSNKLRFLQIPWIYSSSYWQLLRKPDGNFISDYHFLKHSVEEYLMAFQGNNFTSLVLFDTYGPGDTRGKIVQKLMELSPGAPALDLSPGYQFINLTHIKDVCSGIFQQCINLLTQNPSEKRLFLASSQFVTLRELVSEIELVRGVKLPLEWGAREYRVGEILEIPVGEPSVQNWEASIKLRQGLITLI
jgi:CDP-3, 6-dideoxy-D-glycero-L-glycero-4-hexulose-4-reductase